MQCIYKNQKAFKINKASYFTLRSLNVKFFSFALNYSVIHADKTLIETIIVTII